jgi:hypothetical protein
MGQNVYIKIFITVSDSARLDKKGKIGARLIEQSNNTSPWGELSMG